jgi:hypothetical protein
VPSTLCQCAVGYTNIATPAPTHLVGGPGHMHAALFPPSLRQVPPGHPQLRWLPARTPLVQRLPRHPLYGDPIGNSKACRGVFTVSRPMRLELQHPVRSDAAFAEVVNILRPCWQHLRCISDWSPDPCGGRYQPADPYLAAVFAELPDFGYVGAVMYTAGGQHKAVVSSLHVPGHSAWLSAVA